MLTTARTAQAEPVFGAVLLQSDKIGPPHRGRRVFNDCVASVESVHDESNTRMGRAARCGATSRTRIKLSRWQWGQRARSDSGPASLAAEVSSCIGGADMPKS